MPLQECFKNTTTFKKPLRVLMHESSFICIDHQLIRELTVLPNINGQVNIHRWKEINSKVQRGLWNLWAKRKDVERLGRLRAASWAFKCWCRNNNCLSEVRRGWSRSSKETKFCWHLACNWRKAKKTKSRAKTLGQERGFALFFNKCNRNRNFAK